MQLSWSQIQSWTNKTIQPDAKYSVETEGYNVRVYEFTPVSDSESKSASHKKHMEWLPHDLARLLNERIQRLFFVDENYDPESNKESDEVYGKWDPHEFPIVFFTAGSLSKELKRADEGKYWFTSAQYLEDNKYRTFGGFAGKLNSTIWKERVPPGAVIESHKWRNQPPRPVVRGKSPTRESVIQFYRGLL